MDRNMDSMERVDSGDWGLLAASQGGSLWDGHFRGGSGEPPEGKLRGDGGYLLSQVTGVGGTASSCVREGSGGT